MEWGGVLSLPVRNLGINRTSQRACVCCGVYCMPRIVKVSRIIQVLGFLSIVETPKDRGPTPAGVGPLFLR